MEEMLRFINERNRRTSEFIRKNSDVLNQEIVQQQSEVELFNRIGDYATSKNFHPVYFKSKNISNCNSEEPKIVEVHYIHIYNDNGLKVSIYYDGEGSILSLMEQPYYELYDLSNVRKFLTGKEEELLLFNEVKSIL